MTQQEKDLLLKDLSARLPYGVKGIITYNGDKDIFTVKGIFNVLFLSDTECCKVEDFKPYLRPMSSMTEEERNSLRAYCRTQEGIIYDVGVAGAINSPAIIDWLNSHHLDYRGLIKKGLALEVPKGIYRKEKQQ